MARPRHISYVSLYQVCLGTLAMCRQRFLQNLSSAEHKGMGARDAKHTQECFERAWHEAGLHRLQLSMNDPAQQYLLVECLGQVALGMFARNQQATQANAANGADAAASDDTGDELFVEKIDRELMATWTALALLFAFLTQPMRTLPPEGQPDDWPFCPVALTDRQIDSLLDALEPVGEYSLGEHAMATLHMQGAFAVYPDGALPPRLQRILDHGDSSMIASEGRVGVLEKRLAAIDQCAETVQHIKDDIGEHCKAIRVFGTSDVLAQMDQREREYTAAVPMVPGHSAHSKNPGGRIILPRFAATVRRRLAKFSE